MTLLPLPLTLLNILDNICVWCAIFFTSSYSSFFIPLYSVANNYCSLLVVTVYTGESSEAEKKQQLGFRPVHFAAVGLPLKDTSPNGDDLDQKRGAFKIDDGNVVGMCRSST